MGAQPIPLDGFVNHAIRVADTVHRDSGSWTDTIHALLRHLRARGFSYAPEPLGLDDAGREVLAWIDGDIANPPWPERLRSLDGLHWMGGFVRRYHEALAGFDPGPEATWRIGKRTLEPDEIVCHGDLCPWNMVFRGEELVGLIDWDLAEPGRPIDDLAQLAWALLPIPYRDLWREQGFATEPDPAPRLVALCAGYGWQDPREVIEAIKAWQRRSIERMETWGRAGVYPWSRFVELGFLARAHQEAIWVETALEPRLWAGVLTSMASSGSSPKNPTILDPPDSQERPAAALIIETPRLILREMEASDLDALLRVLGDPIAMRHYLSPLSVDGVADWIARQVQRYADCGHGLWSMVLKDTGEVIGDRGLTMQRVGYSPDRQLEAGWHVRRDLWNRGFATEAGLACRDYARDVLQRDHLIAIVGRDNVQSQTVARKLGMTQEREDTLDDQTRLIFGTELVRS